MAAAAISGIPIKTGTARPPLAHVKVRNDVQCRGASCAGEHAAKGAAHHGTRDSISHARRCPRGLAENWSTTLGLGGVQQDERKGRLAGNDTFMRDNGFRG
jgi:hypothetical protein